MNLSGFVVIKNGIQYGAPFIESILSILPACDEFIVSDGYSDDGTYEALQRLQRMYPKKIRLFQDRWPEKSNEGSAVAMIQNKAFKRCRGRWVLNLQADEFMPAENIEYLRGIVKPRTLLDRLTGRRRFNSYLLDRFDVSDHFQQIFQGYTQRWGIRLVRNRPLVYSGGDGWSFLGLGTKPIGAAHLPRPYLHFGFVFPINIARKNINHANYYANEDRSEAVRESRLALEKYERGELPPLPTTNPLNLPPLIAPLIGLAEYRVREELFEKPPR